MTKRLETPRLSTTERKELMLPLDPAQLSHVLCRPADLARLLGTSRQSVSRWLSEGKMALRADGLLDPVRAVRQLLANSDPARLRATVLRPLTRDAEILRGEIAVLRERITALGCQLEERGLSLYRLGDEFERFESLLARQFVERGLAPTLSAAHDELLVLRKQAATEADGWAAALNEPGDKMETLLAEVTELLEASRAGGSVARIGMNEGGAGNA